MTSHVLENMSEAITNNYSTSHQAIDIVAEGNNVDDVIAISDGIVEMAVKDIKYTDHSTKGTATYGNFVKLRHENGQKSLYAHLKYGSVTVSTGETVSKGQKIGTMGATGNAYGTHLHFEVRNANETRENPNNYLNGTLSLDPVKKEEAEEIIEEITEEEENDEIINTNNENIVNNSTQKENNNSSNNINTSNNVKETNTILENNNILENKNYYGGSIVDGLKGIGIDSSFDNRTIIAEKNGIENYRGTYNQNVYLLKLLKQGKLKA